MFANLFPSTDRTSSADYDQAFIQEVRVHQRIRRDRRSERLLVIGWILIAIKSWAMFWLVDRYQMPINAWWIVAPTIAAGIACTWIYWRRS